MSRYGWTTEYVPVPMGRAEVMRVAGLTGLDPRTVGRFTRGLPIETSSLEKIMMCIIGGAGGGGEGTPLQ